ncbi:MAG: hypothetical protein GY750_14255 [Lentisphaerae bacterium]|nr:hypothetical protein [Lentisphaerota bacterium]MCP4102563.1 hypothetical protein [Lentisphaerota bacterium]
MKLCQNLDVLLNNFDIVFLYGKHDHLDDPPLELAKRYLVDENCPGKKNMDIALGIEGRYSLKFKQTSNNKKQLSLNNNSSSNKKVLSLFESHNRQPNAFHRNSTFPDLGMDSPRLNSILESIFNSGSSSFFSISSSDDNQFGNTGNFEIFPLDSKLSNLLLTENKSEVYNYLQNSVLLKNRHSRDYSVKSLGEMFDSNYGDFFNFMKKYPKDRFTSKEAFVTRLVVQSLIVKENFIIERLTQNERIAQNIIDTIRFSKQNLKKKKLIVTFGLSHMFDIKIYNKVYHSIHSYVEKLSRKYLQNYYNRKVRIAVVNCVATQYREESIYSSVANRNSIQNSFSEVNQLAKQYSNYDSKIFHLPPSNLNNHYSAEVSIYEQDYINNYQKRYTEIQQKIMKSIM